MISNQYELMKGKRRVKIITCLTAVGFHKHSTISSVPSLFTIWNNTNALSGK